MEQKLKQRLGGVLLITLGAGYTIYEWREALTSGIYHPKAAFLFPTVAVLGLAVLLSPINKDELLGKYGVERPSSLAHYNWGQRILFILALVAGALNWALISGTLAR
jgi:hypothetical protein